MRRLPCLILFGIILSPVLANAKPLKVFILAGQSNMEGHAQTRTFPAVAKDPETADLHKKMVDGDGEPIVHEDIWMSYAFFAKLGKAFAEALIMNKKK